MKRLLTSILTIVLCTACMGQSARAVLDRAANAIRQSGTIYAQFRITMFDGLTPTSTTDGQLWMQAEKFKMATPELTTWCDGQTLWSMMEGSGEVNILTPDDGELTTTSPYKFLGMYKKGFATSMTKGVVRQEPVYTVTLKAKDKKQSLQTVLIDVAQSDYHLVCIRAKIDGQWTRIQLPTLTPNYKTTQDIFTFDASQYPGIMQIDLR